MHINDLEFPTLNECYMLADSCFLKIEPTVNMNIDLTDYEMIFTNVEYVVKSRHPTYEMARFFTIYDLHIYLTEFRKEFDKHNSYLSQKREGEWKDEFEVK